MQVVDREDNALGGKIGHIGVERRYLIFGQYALVIGACFFAWTREVDVKSSVLLVFWVKGKSEQAHFAVVRTNGRYFARQIEEGIGFHFAIANHPYISGLFNKEEAIATVASVGEDNGSRQAFEHFLQIQRDGCLRLRGRGKPQNPPA